MAHAEKKGVTVCLEHLNTRDDSHPMKGHPGYQGDDLDYVAKIIRAVGSPRVKLLFDVYHVQIMHGDVIRRIEQCKDIIGHIHTAGNPGRGELDDTQEINYPPIMKKLLAIKYAGYVGQEFIPTRDPKAGLAEALQAVRRVSRAIRRLAIDAVGVDAKRVRYFATRPTPNWSPVFTTFPPFQWTSTIFSLCTSRPFSSFSAVTIFFVFTSITSPVDG